MPPRPGSTDEPRGPDRQQPSLGATLTRGGANFRLFSRSASGLELACFDQAAEAKRGTYAGLIEKIPCLQDLGITAVELLAVFQPPPAGEGEGNGGRRWIDNARATPDDIAPWEQAPAVPGGVGQYLAC